MRWQFFRQGRQRTHSRPRVASAALAARNVRMEMGLEMSMQMSMQRYPGASEGVPAVTEMRYPSARIGNLSGLGSAQVAASPIALSAAARASNRSVEEVWEETLAAWLEAEERRSGQSAPPAEPARARRRTVWHEIDSTMLSLRAV